MAKIIFFTAVIFSITLIFSLKFSKKHFHKFELLLLFMFSSTICQLTFYKLFSPYDRLGEVQKLWQDLTVKIHYGLILPLLLIWTMYIYCSNSKEIIKIATIFSWIVFGIIAEKFYLTVGVLQSKSESWYPSIDIVFEMIIILFTIFFLENLKIILRKEKIV